jgi:hypothetical protein
MARIRAWLRVPVLLSKFPAILLSVVGAGVVLAVASAASTLFLASAGTAAVQQDVEASGGRLPAFTVIDYSTPEADLSAFRERLLVPPLVHAGLSRPVESVFGTQVTVSPVGRAADAFVVPMTRQGAAAHVTMVRGTSGPGALLSEEAATAMKVGPGDRLTVASGNGRTRLLVSGIYKDLALQPRTTYWAPLAGLIYTPQGDPDTPPPPPFLILDQPTLTAMLQDLGGQGQFRWEFGLDTSTLTLPQAARLADVVGQTQGSLGDGSTQLGSAFPGTTYSSPLFGWVTDAQQTVGAITGPV